MAKVALIDYGSGNLRSAEKALAVAAAQASGAHQIVVTYDPETVASADALVLPGVGAFAHCMDLLHARDGLIEAMHEAAHKKGSPFLGICVGMQLLATRGLEFGETAGLDWIKGDVRKLEPDAGHALKVPHMGWNALTGETGHALLAGASKGAHVYFTHSFVLDPKDNGDVIAWTDHGGPIVAAVAKNNIAGFQFHPEKSQGVGLRLLADFLEWRP
jgi:glutamine amidotransferase